MRTLAIKNLTSRPARTILTAAGIAIGVCALTLMISLSEGLKSAAYEGFGADSALTRLIVQEKPQGTVMSLFPIERRDRIDNAVMQNITLIPHVETVHPEMIYARVSSLEVGWLGRGLRTDSMVFGVPYDLIADEYEGTRESWDNAGEPYPALVSSKIIDIYNFTVAPASGLPTFSEKELRNVEVKILPGQSTFFPATQNPSNPVPARITGFSGKTSLVGITVPLDLVRRMNLADDPGYTDRYMRLFLKVDKPENIESVRERIRETGLEALSPIEEIKTVSENLMIMEMGLGMIGIIILAVAGLMIANTFLSAVGERRHEIGLYRSLGATRSDIRNIFLTEAALIGLGGGLAGIFFALVAAVTTNRLILDSLPEVSFKPDSLFSYNPLIFILILAFAVFVSVIFAYLPALHAARTRPLEALTRE